ncbi:YggT family protein [Henriciella sp. AS95]|uniref:YggT family protein n=1 Tax=Henriciella sp. AS95 TaxID=3135782 RepID=UPI00317C9D1A
MRAVLDIVMIILQLGIWILIAQAVLSWLIAFNVLNTRNQFVAGLWNFLQQITEPLCRPIRRMLPRMSGIDLSPLVLILIIIFLQRVIAYYVYPNVV